MSVLLTIGLIICLMFCGLSLDIGMMELEKTQMQTAADAAAIAGDMYFERALDGAIGAETAAAAAQYGYVNGSNQTTVTAVASLSQAAVGGDYAGHYDTIQVTITRQLKTLFMGLLNRGTVTVSAVGTASPPPCQYYLGTKGMVPYTVNLQNTASIAQWYTKCSAYVAGGMFNPPGAWWQAWQTYFTGTSAASVLLGRTKQGTTFNSVAVSDPLAGLAQPSPGGCSSNNFSRGNLVTTTTVTLNPGTYCGSVNAGIVTPGMTLVNATVTFNPGLYVITGGMNWQKLNATGNGVTFFFTNVSGTGSYGLVSLSGGYSTLNLSASSGTAFGTTDAHGAKAGVLFFGDRNWVNTTPQDFFMNPVNGTINFNGVWYLPSTGLSMQNGNAYCYTYCAMIADNLYVGNFNNQMTGTDYTRYPGDNALRRTSVLVQ